MTINITLDDDTMDGIILDALIEQRECVKYFVKQLKKVKNPRSFELEDLANDKKVLKALNVLCEYYGEGLR
jgi:hypothetical protein